MSSKWEILNGDNDSIKTLLAGQLKKGQLMLVLGAGASASVGLPSWINLVNKCIDKCNADKNLSPEIQCVNDNDSILKILRRTSTIKKHYSEIEFTKLVKDSLYSNLNNTQKETELPEPIDLVNKYIEHINSIEPKSDPILLLPSNSSPYKAIRKAIKLTQLYGNEALYNITKEFIAKTEMPMNGFDSLLKNDLLIAIGSLLMGTQRGNISDVVTYNFDDVLEWYLNLHGFVIQIITDPLSLNRKVDVRIYHPHGFLPFNGEFTNSRKLVFDEESFNQRIGNLTDSPWRTNLEMLLSTKTAIFIGLSGDDPTFGPMLNKVSNWVESRDTIGYWFRKRPIDPDDEVSDKNNKIIPIYVDEYEDIPKFLLDISQRASKDINSQQ